MPGFKLDALVYALDIDDFNKVVDAFINTEMQRGIRAFLKACLARIPVRTGFLKGAFREIIRKFSATGNTTGAELNPILSALFTAGGEHGRPGGLFKEREAHHDRKLTSAGKAAREKALRAQIEKARKEQARRANKRKPKSALYKNEYYYDGRHKVLKTPTSGIAFATKPDDVLKINGNQAIFFLDVAISYYRVNDFYSRIKGSPWQSLDAGAAAMVTSLERSVNRFPAIADILASFKIALRGSRLTKEKTKGKADLLVSNRTLRITGFDNG
jgi:hypothetical protein